MRVRSALVAGVLTSALALPAAHGASAAAVVLLPPENLSGAGGAEATVARALADALSRRGWTVHEGQEVDDVLLRLRERRLDSLPPAQLSKVVEPFDATAVVYSTIDSWLDGPNAIVAISARLVRADGTATWTAFASRTAEQTESALGFHRANDAASVSALVLRRLLEDLPTPAEEALRWSRRTRPLEGERPVTFRSVRWPAQEKLRVFLVPFSNQTRDRLGPRLVTGILARRLTESGAFAVVEPAELQAALVAEKIPNLRWLTDPERLHKVAARVGTPILVRGAVWQWREGNAQGGARAPLVELEVELVDTGSGQVLWAGHHARSGDEYERLFRQGAIGDVTALADQVLAEMIDAALHARPVGPATTADRPAPPSEKTSPPPNPTNPPTSAGDPRP